MKRILIVDDEAAVVRVYTRVLSCEGYEVMEATSLVEATAILQTSVRLDAVLLDLNLAGEDGGILVPVIRKHHASAAIALISGYYDAARWLEVAPQCDVALPKPVTPDTLRELIKRLETRRSAGLAELAQEYGLAESEIKVLEDAQSFATIKEIAAHMGLARATVETYLQRIYDKMGIRSLREILALMYRRNKPRRGISPPNSV